MARREVLPPVRGLRKANVEAVLVPQLRSPSVRVRVLARRLPRQVRRLVRDLAFFGLCLVLLVAVYLLLRLKFTKGF